jgi:hypothetical protein
MFMEFGETFTVILGIRVKMIFSFYHNHGTKVKFFLVYAHSMGKRKCYVRKSKRSPFGLPLVCMQLNMLVNIIMEIVND